MPWHFDTQQNSNLGSSACSYGFMTLKNTGARSLIYICAVWSSLRPQEDNRSLPGSSINRQSPKQAINIPISPHPLDPDQQTTVSTPRSKEDPWWPCLSRPAVTLACSPAPCLSGTTTQGSSVPAKPVGPQ